MSTDRPTRGAAPTTREDGLSVERRTAGARTTREDGRRAAAAPGGAARTTLEPGGSQVPAPATTVEAAAGAVRWARVNLPPALRNRYVHVRDIDGVGAEGDLVVCRQIDDDRLVVVKLYRHSKVDVDVAMLERVRDADRVHFVELITWDRADGVFWEVMEYVDEGSLADLAEREGRPGLPLPRLREVLDELAPAIEHLHAMKLVHRDIKPSNVLVRRRQPLDLVLADFGLTVAVALSRERRSGSRTQAYAAPEAAWGDTWPGLDWWSLGITLLELATGHHPFRHEDGRWFDDAEINAQIASTTIDVSKVPDERWQRLLRGLLTADRRHRWGPAQVKAWQEGHDPDVHLPGPVAAGQQGDVVAFGFAGQEYTTPETLAAAMAANWSASAGLVLGRDLDDLEVWLRQFGRRAALDEAIALARARPDVNRCVARLVVQLSPTQQPTFMGFSVLPHRLAALATRAATGPGAERAAVAALQRSHALTAYADLPECGNHGLLDERWQRLMDEAGRRVASAGVPVLASAVPRDLLAARLLLLLTDNAERRRVQTAARRARKQFADVSWFAALARAATPDLEPVIDLLAVVAGPIAADEQHERRRRADESRRQASSAALAAAARRRRPFERRLLVIVVAVLVTAAGPYYLGQRIWDERLAPPLPTGPYWPAVSPAWLYAPEYVFGALLVLGAAGVLALLLPPYRAQTRRRMVLVGVLVAAGVSAPWAADATRGAILDQGRRDFVLGPVPIERLGPTCGLYWTDAEPVRGSVHRYALTDQVGGSDSRCSKLRSFAGWGEGWSLSAPRNSWFVSMAMYGRQKTLVVRRDIVGRANVLLGLNPVSGRTKWTWECPKRDVDHLTGEVYHGVADKSAYVNDKPYIQVRCADGTRRVDAASGKTLGR